MGEGCEAVGSHWSVTWSPLCLFDTDIHLSTFGFPTPLVSIFLEIQGAPTTQKELQREIDDLIYSLRRKKHDLYRQNGT